MVSITDGSTELFFFERNNRSFEGLECPVASNPHVFFIHNIYVHKIGCVFISKAIATKDGQLAKTSS